MRKFIAVLVMTGVTFTLFAQVQDDKDVITPTPQFQDHGGVTPWFWIGIQSIFSGGYNIQTGAGGFRDYGGSDNTYASFNLAFVDSHYATPKFYEVPRELDPNMWTGKFKLMNFTTRINSWSQNEDAIENNRPAWLAEIAGHGAHIGFFTQAGNLIGGLNDTQSNSNSPITTITGGNMVIPLGDDDLGRLYYNSTNAGNKTTYSTSRGALVYGGYVKEDLLNVYLTMLSEGNVNSDVSKKGNNAFAGVIDFGVTPFGVFTDDEHPFTFGLTGNAIAGFGWENAANDTKNVGFGAKLDAGFYLGRDNFVLSPVFAFDGRIEDDAHDYKLHAKFGGGLVFQFSGMRWVSDDWNELWGVGKAKGIANQDYRYETNKILKFTYFQAYAAYSEAEDMDLLFRFEEPDGDAGFHNKIGALLEARVYNLTKKVDINEKPWWQAQGRFSYDMNIKSIPFTPAIRAYLDSASVLKLRLEADANIIPYTCFTLAYTSANLNKGADKMIAKAPNSGDSDIFDAGRIELIVTLKSDAVRPRPPKRMNEWNYATTLTDM
ncbi:MAG: hypothetical protein LBH75_04410 [Treponema sp.]|jgi:hypothetical protein|nr:hypothetical protein [Treponema sp.]